MQQIVTVFFSPFSLKLVDLRVDTYFSQDCEQLTVDKGERFGEKGKERLKGRPTKRDQYLHKSRQRTSVSYRYS